MRVQNPKSSVIKRKKRALYKVEVCWTQHNRLRYSYQIIKLYMDMRIYLAFNSAFYLIVRAFCGINNAQG